MVLLTPHEETGRRGVVEHADYLIDRFRVGYQFGGGWKCGCADFAASDACRHTREAEGRRAAQIRIVEHIKKGSLDLNSRRRSVRRERGETVAGVSAVSLAHAPEPLNRKPAKDHGVGAPAPDLTTLECLSATRTAQLG